MYDTLICRRVLPDGLDGCATDFQTKDMDCLLNEYEILGDGSIVLRAWIIDGVVPPEQRPYPPGHRFHDLIGVVTSRVLPPERVMHHGDIVFYTRHADTWHEYRARFTHGVLEDIIVVPGRS